jgi:hypothetical protein
MLSSPLRLSLPLRMVSQPFLPPPPLLPLMQQQQHRQPLPLPLLLLLLLLRKNPPFHFKRRTRRF